MKDAGVGGSDGGVTGGGGIAGAAGGPGSGGGVVDAGNMGNNHLRWWFNGSLEGEAYGQSAIEPNVARLPDSSDESPPVRIYFWTLASLSRGTYDCSQINPLINPNPGYVAGIALLPFELLGRYGGVPVEWRSPGWEACIGAEAKMVTLKIDEVGSHVAGSFDVTLVGSSGTSRAGETFRMAGEFDLPVTP